MQPTVASNEPSTDRPADVPDGTPPGTSRRALAAVAVVAALLVAATIVAVVVNAVGSRPVTDGDVAWTVQTPREGRSEARLEIPDGAPEIRVVAADLGDQLLRAETPVGGAAAPEVTTSDGVVRVGLTDTGYNGSGELRVTVHSDLLWSVRVAGGATRTRVDLTGARVSHVDVAGGASALDLALPEPSGTVDVRMSGGVSTWRIELPQQTPVRIRLGSGAGSVDLDGERSDGVAGGETVASTDWEEATDRYDVDAVAGVADLTVTRR
ncbi:hypothetical protein O7543_04615 [Solwaraspora sp. WMMA2080]|uniref:hypothetical protein n=1 Tax=unclassified Solwaraspora TaxID=2627926 RepID=UPI00248C33D8|nr:MULTISPECIES: hypothetical protein [unclassified Solwaraspora]WBB99686.1 hypothetical protein O7553_12755 [Solwaraspora sp. WMMA2059]WBC21764.1 hypothetical protein O7543_04615 [Solwaraspora sp. WMMA2080]